MKIGALIARIIMGLMFVVFGSNSFLHFIPMPPLPPTPAGQWVGAMIPTHYFMVVGAAQVIGGLLLIINRFVPVGLAILGPVIVNILSYHFLMDIKGVGGAILVAVLWCFLFYAYRDNFKTMFAAKAEPH
jgi:putative oxidoreductase